MISGTICNTYTTYTIYVHYTVYNPAHFFQHFKVRGQGLQFNLTSIIRYYIDWKVCEENKLHGGDALFYSTLSMRPQIRAEYRHFGRYKGEKIMKSDYDTFSCVERGTTRLRTKNVFFLLSSPPHSYRHLDIYSVCLENRALWIRLL